MEFLTRGYIAIRGDRGQPQAVDETIEKLADCLETATLLEDRRAGVLSLKGLVRDYPENVGDKSLNGLIKVLHMDYRDVDVIKSVLETLTVLCTVTHKTAADDHGYKYTNEFIKDSSNVTILLDILEDFDFYVRYNTIKFLATLSANRVTEIQQCILTSPMGITRLVDLLDDKRDIIRNEGLLLLITLTQNNTEIQKLVAFQATFEKLLAILEEEEGISGGIVVQDSLTLMQILLRYNASNQVYFRETSCIQQIPGLLGFVGDSDGDHVPFSNEDWPPQKVSNTTLVLELVRILAEPEGTNTPANQKVMAQSNILLPIVQLAVCSNAPSIVRTEALYAIAHVIRSNTTNQEMFSKIAVASPPPLHGEEFDPSAMPGLPRPAVVSLIAIAVAADIGFSYSYASRAAAAYAVFSCIDSNADGQLVLVSTLKMPPDDNVNSGFADKPFSAGSLLLETIQNWELSRDDPYKVWFACAILCHAIYDNERAKQLAGTIVFGDAANGEEPVPLLHQVVAQLLLSAKDPSVNARIPIAYLCLLCTWLYDSPSSVSLFLSESTHVQFLIQDVQSSVNDPIVQGLTAFLLGITYEYNNDPNTPLDRNKLQSILSSRVDQLTSQMSRLRDSTVIKNVPQYLQVSAEEEAIVKSTGSLPSLFLESSFVEFVKDNHETILRSLKKKPASFKPKQAKTDEASSGDNANESIVQFYKTKVEQQANEIAALQHQVLELQTQLASERATLQGKLDTLEKEQEDLLVCMGEQDLDIKKYRARLRALNEPVTDSEEEEEE